MKQKARQNVTSSVERDFYKLLNNSNFGIDCTNNIDNCFLEPLFDDFSEMSYIKKFATIFNDNTFRNFFSPFLLQQEIIQTFESKIFSLNKEDPTYGTRVKYYERQMEEELDVVDSFKKKQKNKKKEGSKTWMKKLLSVLTQEKLKW